ELACVALVLAALRALDLAVVPQLDRVPALDDAGATAAEHLDAFSRAGAIAAGLVRDRRDRAVLVPHRQEDAVVGGLDASDLAGRLGEHAHRRATDDRGAGVDRVARLADDAAAADVVVLR